MAFLAPVTCQQQGLSVCQHREAAWAVNGRWRMAACSGNARRRVAAVSKSEGMDAVDSRQQVDIDRFIVHSQELQARVEEMEAQLQSFEERSKDRAVALRAILRDDKEVDKLLQQDDGQLELPPDDQQEPWDSYRASFTLALSKTYIRTVDGLRNRLMATEWELGLRPIALQLGVSRFESWCAENGEAMQLPKNMFDTISELYEDPTDLRRIKNPALRMRARSMITQTEAEERAKAWEACSLQAQKLASQFSEAEFISSLIPDQIEHGVIDGLRKLVAPMMAGKGRPG